MIDIDKLGWIFIQDKRLLGARSKGKNLYYIPGGKREEGESDHEALIREIKEELSVDLIFTTLKYVGVFHAQADDKASGTRVKITCYSAEFTGLIKANAEIEEVSWLNYADKVHCSPVTMMIMDWLKSDGLIE